MEVSSQPSNGAYPDKDSLRSIQKFYDQGLYLKAYELSASIAPVETWRGLRARILAGRLCCVLGASRTGGLIHYIAWREFPNEFETLYFYARYLFRRRGGYATRKLLQRHINGIKPSEPALQGEWLAFQAVISAYYRDFTTSERQIEQSLEVSPDNPWLFVEQSHVLEREDRFEDALAAVDKALELDPWFRSAIQQKAHVLQQIGRDEEALQILQTADQKFECEAVSSQLLAIQMENNLLQDAQKTLARIETLSPMADSYFKKWLAARKSDVLYKLGEIRPSITYALKADNPFHLKIADNLKKNESAKPPVLLAVNFIRQNHNTCGPATMAALCRFFGKNIHQDQIIDSIWYHGTQNVNERQWLIKNGWLVKEFKVTWESAVALLDLNVPFALTTAETDSAHLQAIIGYDEARETLFIRDPMQRCYQEVLGRQFLKSYQSTGPRGLVFLPPDKAEILELTELPEVELYDQFFHLQVALQNHQRKEAAEYVKAITESNTQHRMCLIAQRALAIYDQNETKILTTTRMLLDMYPDTGWLQLSLQESLRRLELTQDRMSFLEELYATDKSHPQLQIEYANLLLNDTRNYTRVSRILDTLLKRNPYLSKAYSALAHIKWQQHLFDESLRLYRAAATLQDDDEWYLKNYFRAARFLHQDKNVLKWLKNRFEKHMAKSCWPAITLYEAYELLDRSHDGLRMLKRAITQRPKDGELQIFAAKAFARNGLYPVSEKLLRLAEKNAHREDWMAACAEVHQLKGEVSKSLRLWLQVAAANILNYQAHRAIVGLLAKTKSRQSAASYIENINKRFSHSTEIYRIWLDCLADEPLTKSEAVLKKYQEIDPNNAWICRELAYILIRQSRLAGAKQYIERARILEPNHYALYQVMGDWALKTGNIKLAQKAFRNAIRLNVDSEYACIKLLESVNSNQQKRHELGFVKERLVSQVTNGGGLLAYHQQAMNILTPDELTETLKEAWKARPDLWQTWSALTTHLQDMGRLDKARKIIDQGVAAFPLIPRLRLDQARGFRLSGDATAEQKSLRQALKVNPDYEQAVLELAESYVRSARLDDAKDILQKALSRNPLCAGYHGCLANVFWKQSQQEEALQRIRRAIELSANYVWAWNQLKSWAKVLKQPELPVQIAKKMVGDQSGEAERWIILAKMLDDETAALSAVDKAIQLEPRNIMAHTIKIQILAGQKRYVEALAAVNFAGWEKSVPIEIRFMVPWITRCEGRQEKAIDDLKRLLRDEPTYSDGWRMLAIWLEQSERFEEALDAARRFAELAPNDEVAQAILGDVMLDCDDRSGAKRHYQRSTVLNPDYTYAGLSLFDLQLEDNEIESAAVTLEALERPTKAEGIVFIKSRKVQLMAAKKRKAEALNLFREISYADQDNEWPLHACWEAFKKAGWQKDIHDLLAEFYLQPRGVHPYIGVLWSENQKESGRWTMKSPEVKRLLNSGAMGMKIIEQHIYDLAQRNFPGPLNKLIKTYRTQFHADVYLWGAVGYAWILLNAYRQAVKWMSDWETREYVPPWVLYNLCIGLRAIGRWKEASHVAECALEMEADHTVNEHRIWLCLEKALGHDDSVWNSIFLNIDPSNLTVYDNFAYNLLKALNALRNPSLKSRKDMKADVYKAIREAVTLNPGYIRDRVLRRIHQRVLKHICKKLAPLPLSLFYKIKLSYNGIS